MNIDHLRDGGSLLYFIAKPYSPKQFWLPFSVTPPSLSNFLWHPHLLRNPLSLNSLPRLKFPINLKLRFICLDRLELEKISITLKL